MKSEKVLKIKDVPTEFTPENIMLLMEAEDFCPGTSFDVWMYIYGHFGIFAKAEHVPLSIQQEIASDWYCDYINGKCDYDRPFDNWGGVVGTKVVNGDDYE